MARQFLTPVATPASTTAAESLNIPVGVAPTAPAVGAVWMQTDGLYYRNNAGVSVGPLAAAGAAALTSTYIGVGNGANSLSGSSALVFNGNTMTLTATSAKLQVFAHAATTIGNPAGLTNVIGEFQDSTNAISGVALRNANSGAAAEYRFAVFDEGGSDTTRSYLAFSMGSQNNTATLAGYNRSQIATIFLNGGASVPTVRSLGLLTVNAGAVFIGTNNVERMRFFADGGAQYGGTITTSPGANNLMIAGVAAVGVAAAGTTTLNLAAGTTAASSLRLNPGVAPTAPVDGDVWLTTAGVFARVASTTVQLSNVFSGSVSANQIAYGSGTNALTGSGNLTYDGSTFSTNSNANFYARVTIYSGGLMPLYVNNSVTGPTGVVIRNGSNNAAANANFACANDLSTGLNWFLTGGINSSTYSGGVFGGASEGFLYTSSSSLNIGSANNGSVMRVLVGGSSVTTNTVMTFAQGVITVSNNAQFTAPRTAGGGNYNEAFGANVLMTINGGWSNTAVGNSTAYHITTGYENVAVGAAALNANTTGFENVAIGCHAYEANLTGSGATVVGFRAAKLATIGNVTAVGFYALQALTTGTGNVAVGTNAQYSNQTGADNVAIGSAALYNNTAGGGQVAVGSSALFSYNSSGNGSNTAVGNAALYTVVNGFANTAIGFLALQFMGDYYNNTAVGSQALWVLSTGISNTAMGVVALGQLTNGSGNVSIGSDSGRNGSTPLTTLTNCTFLGTGSTATVNSITGSTAVGAGATITKTHQIVIGEATVTETVIFGITICVASSTSFASLRIPAGTAPTTPADGDVWATTVGMFNQINGVTRALTNNLITSQYVSSNYSMLISDEYIECIGAGGQTVTLVAANAVTSHSVKITVKNQTGTTVYIAPAGTDTIDLAAGSLALLPGDSVDLIADKTSNWSVT